MNSFLTFKTDTLANCVLVYLVIVIFMPIWRSTLLDSPYLRDIPLFILVIFWMLFLIKDVMHGSYMQIDLLDLLAGIYLLYGIFAIIYAMDNAGLDLFMATRQFRNYYFPVILYFIARRAFVSLSTLKSLLLFLLIIYLVNTFYIIIEYGGQFVGFDLHRLPWHVWRTENDLRFESSNLLNLGTISTFAFGIQGFPHYTAPGLVALFCMVFPFAMLNKESYTENWLFGNHHRLAFFGIITMMILSMMFLSVKTHMATTLLVIFVSTIIIRPRYLLYSVIVLIVLIVILLNSQMVVDRLNILWNQITIGDVRSGSRIESIFHLEGIIYYLSQSPKVILFGTGNLLDESLFDDIGYLFEIKFVVYLLTFGAAWFLLFCGINLAGVIYSFNVFRNKYFPLQERFFAFGIIGMCAVYFLEMTHFGQAVAMPNIEIWCVSLGAFSAMRSRLKYCTNTLQTNKKTFL